MNEFKRFHPLVNFIFFALVITLSVLLWHPVCLMVSFVTALCYYAVLKGGASAVKRLFLILPMILLMALLNPAYNHAGVTVLTYLPSGNPLTMESIVFGIFAATMIASVILWFSCYNEVMTTDKFVYLFGRILPALSLLLSMALRFVPKFAAEARVVKHAQEGLGRSLKKGGLLRRVQTALAIFSVMVTWALESSLITADSMRARGYGLPGRTAFSIFCFEKRDLRALLYLIFFFSYTAVGIGMGKLSYSYFPYRTALAHSFYSVSLYVSYWMVCSFPIFLEFWEVIRWRSLESAT